MQKLYLWQCDLANRKRQITEFPRIQAAIYGIYGSIKKDI
jgi:hypothetical protein